MKRFENGQRVQVTASELEICGGIGTVVRLRRVDNGAWVQMDSDLPDELRAFPAGDSRANNIVLYPWDCALAATPTGGDPA